MSEYVKTEDVLSKLYLSHKDVTYIDKNAAADRIKKIPSIDIVRCKECRYWDNTDNAERCSHEYGGMWAKPDDFCSYGVKKGADDERSNNESAVIFR